MVLPEPGFHEALRELTRAAGTLLLIDETHTISSGPGGYTRQARAGAGPVRARQADRRRRAGRVWGMSDEVATRYAAYNETKEPGYSGMGTTLSANPLQFAAMRATLEEVMTDENYAHMERLAARLERGPVAVDRRAIACPGMWPASAPASSSSARRGPLQNGGEAEAAHAPELEAAIHVALVNRGVLIAPFHNMMLVSPATRSRRSTALSPPSTRSRGR